jgi:hypothetical protein
VSPGDAWGLLESVILINRYWLELELTPLPKRSSDISESSSNRTGVTAAVILRRQVILCCVCCFSE